MRLDGYSLEILVDGKPLQECQVPIKQHSFLPTGPSFIFREEIKENVCNEFVTYASIPLMRTHFAIKISASNATPVFPIRAETYIDNISDSTYCELVEPIPRIKEGFWNKDLDELNYFNFEFGGIEYKNFSDFDSYILQSASCLANKSHACQEKESVPLQSSVPLPFGPGYGAVSAYFFKSRKTIRENLWCNPESILKNKITMNTREYNLNDGLMYQIKRNRKTGCEIIRDNSHLEIIDKHQPLAVLHVHYRPLQWLTSRGLIRVEKSQEENFYKSKFRAVKYVSSSTHITNNEEEKKVGLNGNERGHRVENERILNKVKHRIKDVTVMENRKFLSPMVLPTTSRTEVDCRNDDLQIISQHDFFDTLKRRQVQKVDSREKLAETERRHGNPKPDLENGRKRKKILHKEFIELLDSED
ncbi:12536_t:CDS:2 [Acaulospora morrowiae]|uniref:12536_t:CDS:1 n=1 Tax=Acaulospora morrowiae TaxID=94023 RepID=A0A9N9H0N3_9GLOM|nr:12536_t:CDS:2 [Acaulospora morrowiae]